MGVEELVIETKWIVTKKDIEGHQQIVRQAADSSKTNVTAGLASNCERAGLPPGKKNGHVRALIFVKQSKYLVLTWLHREGDQRLGPPPGPPSSASSYNHNRLLNDYGPVCYLSHTNRRSDVDVSDEQDKEKKCALMREGWSLKWEDQV
ncbi:hypothetical protein MMC15_003796 [Xylographa vitiligo]|nr:hypothetical protein [Xylographa vitiligo]